MTVNYPIPNNFEQLGAILAKFTRMAGENDVHFVQLSPTTRVKLTARVRVAWGNRTPYVELEYQVASSSEQWRTVS